MNKKKLFLIILKFFPFLGGMILFRMEIINLFSSLLLFVGGYIVVKNLFDYRIIRKNINNIYKHKKEEEIVDRNISFTNVDSKIYDKNDNLEYRKSYSKNNVKIRRRMK